ncbi:hypothetical protein GCM10027521_22190 [Amycolatopsis cihanbeyliensis]
MLLPGLLHRIAAREHLDVEVADVDMLPFQVPGLVADFDIVVTHRDEYAEPFESERLEVAHLLREPLDVALPPGHPLGARERVDLSEFAGEPWIGSVSGFRSTTCCARSRSVPACAPGWCTGSTTSASSKHSSPPGTG